MLDWILYTITSFAEFGLYKQGLIVGWALAACYLVLSTAELVRCFYWSYVSEDDQFVSFLGLFWRRELDVWSQLDDDAIMGGWLGGAVAIAIVSVAWPLVLVIIVAASVANSHRAVLRLIKRVSKLEKK